MSAPDELSRRGMLVKLGILFNGGCRRILACRSCATSFLP
jgi:hypothetical protein